MSLVYFLIFSMPFYRHPIIDAGSGILTVPKAAGALGLLFCLIHISQHGFPNYFGTRQGKLFLAMFVWAMFSFVREGRAPRMDIGDPSMLYISLFVFFILIVTLIDTPKKIERAFLVALGSISFASFYILREYQVYRFSFPNFRPDAKVLGDANYYSMACMLAFPIGFYMYLAESRRKRRLLLMTLLLLNAVGIAVSGSRGGFLALMAFMAFAAWRARKIVQLMLLVALLALPMMLFPRNPITRMIHPDLADRLAAQARLETWKAGLRMSLQHPLTGIGLGEFRPHLADYTGKPDLAKLAHNTYLEIAAELGFPCLVVYLWLLWETYRGCELIRRVAFRLDDRLSFSIATGLQGGLVGYLVSSFFLSSEYVKFFWFYVFISIAMIRVMQVAMAHRTQNPPAPDEPRTLDRGASINSAPLMPLRAGHL